MAVRLLLSSIGDEGLVRKKGVDMKLKRLLLVAAIVLAALAPWACGGGYSSPTAPNPNMTPGPGPTPTATRY